MKRNLIGLFSLLLVLFNVGCASFQDLMSALDDEPKVPALKDINRAPRYTDNENMAVPTDRNYRRMTKNRMEEESQLGANAGSTWVMEGQGAYLFAQNKMRKEGDLLNVNLDAAAKGQIDNKVSVIKKLLKQLDEQQKMEFRNSLKQGAADARKPAAEEKKAEVAEEKDEAVQVAKVPTRIVEKLPDGNYRIKGQQPFMIGKRDYKVIVTGLIRPEDFNEDGVSSDKLMDPQYDVVSLRKAKTNE